MKCPFCSSNSKPFASPKDYNQKTDLKDFHYYKCGGCRSLFLDHLPSNLGDYYPSAYYRVPKTLDEFDVSSEDYKIAILEKFKQSGRLLEVGPSIGKFAYSAKKEGFEVEVMERSEACCAFISDTLHIQAYQGASIETDLPRNKEYDAIALWHVLEHMSEPLSVLKDLVSRLKSKGVLILAVPNPASLQLKIFEKHWLHLDAPRHLHLLSSEMLTKYLSSLDCSLRYKTTRDEGSLVCDIAGWSVPFNRAIESRKGRLTRDWLVLMRKITLKLGSILELKEGLGTANTFVFEKGV